MRDIHTRIITRADDAGLNISTNQGILEVVRSGFVKNVSFMAVGPYIEEAVKLLKDEDISFGIHLTLNAEWDVYKWSPLSTLDENSHLIDVQGSFLERPTMYAKNMPAVDIIMQEFEAQLQRLKDLGLPVSYADSHMLPELYVPGLQVAMELWMKENDLLNFRQYYRPLPDFHVMELTWENVIEYMQDLEHGQYFCLLHPAKNGNDMKQLGNSRHTWNEVASQRVKECSLFSNKKVVKELQDAGIKTIKYSEAVPDDSIDLWEVKGVHKSISKPI